MVVTGGASGWTTRLDCARGRAPTNTASSNRLWRRRRLAPDRFGARQLGCVEPDAWSLHAQAVYELPLAGALHKHPRLVVDEGMRLERASPSHAALDLVVAFASMKHYIADDVIANGYCAAARLLRPGGLFLQVECDDPSPPVKRDASRRAAASAAAVSACVRGA